MKAVLTHLDLSTNSIVKVGKLGLGSTSSPAYSIETSTTDAYKLPVGTTGQRPTAITGLIRYNSDNNVIEFYNGTTWVSLNTSSLPGGTSGQTLRHDGSTWVATSFLYNNNTAIGINTSSPGTDLHIKPQATGGGVRLEGTASSISPATSYFLGATQYGGIGVAGVNTQLLSSSVVGDFIIKNVQAKDVLIGASDTEVLRVTFGGRVGIGITAPTATFMMRAGTAAAQTAPIKLVSGTLMSTPEAGAIEFLTDRLYFTKTTGPTRETLAYLTDFVPAGSNTQIQYNNNGAFGASSSLTWTEASKQLRIVGPGNFQLNLAYTAGSVYTDIATTSSGHLYIGPTASRVGINTLSPTSNLEILSTLSDSGIYQTSYGTTTYPGLITRRVRGTVNSPTAVQSGDYLTTIGGRGHNGTGITTSSAASMLFIASQNWTTNNNGTYIAFNTTADNTNSSFEALRIAQNGNVGINTTSPVSKLHVYGTATSSIAAALYGATDHLLVSGAGNTGITGLAASAAENTGRAVFKGTRTRGTLSSPATVADGDWTVSLLGAAYDGTSAYATAGIDCIISGTVSTGVVPQAMLFSTGTTNTRTERMRLTPAGNLGVGTTSPASKVAINGGLSTGSGYTGTAAPSGGIISQGYVGIGETSPDTPLHVTTIHGNVATLTLETTASSSTYLQFKNSGSSGNLPRIGINSPGNTIAIRPDGTDRILITDTGTTISNNVTLTGTTTSKRKIINYTTSNNLSTTDNWGVFHNEGATSKPNYSLPIAAAGLHYTIIVQDSDGIDITAQAGDTIRWGTSVTGTGGTITSTTVGASITLVAINVTEWIAISIVGTWT